MSANGNGKWFHAHWVGAVRLNPKESGWYAARPECCDMIVRVRLARNLFDCHVQGADLNYDVYDFSHWYKLESPDDELPEFHE